MRSVHASLAASVFAVVIAGCGSETASSPGTPSDDAGGTDGTLDSVVTNDVGSEAAGDSGTFVLDTSVDAAATYGCSADLRTVLDAKGNVVKTCATSEGCSQGTCVEACVAATTSRGNVGCEFRVATPPAYQTTLPPCFAVVLANTWPEPAKVSVDRDGTTFDVTKFGRIPENGKPAAQWKPIPATGIPVDEVAILFLSGDPASVFPENGVAMNCPVTPAINASTMVDGTGRGMAFHITATAPVSAYDILPYGGARSHFPSAELLFPTSAWDRNFVVIATPRGTHTPPGPLWLQLLSGDDQTSIALLPTVDLPATGAYPAAPMGVPTPYLLLKDQYLQWQLPSSSNDPSGTIIQADKHVTVMAGNRFFRFQPTPGPGGESTHQQILPVRALGREYVAAPFETRRKDLVEELIHYRIVGVADGTTLTFDPPVTGAPATLARSQVADFAATGPFRVSSQDANHPFAAAQIMDTANVTGGSRSGATAPGYAQALGDEEFVIMLPPAQFLSKYVFFTDPAYATTNLALTRRKVGTAFADVTVDCLGTISGWKPVGTTGEFEVTTVDLVRADVSNGTCLNGRHVAQSSGPFGIVVWGLDSYSSYAYPAGGNAAALTTLVVEAKPK